jgi:predicted enzyme related to lactoylglutathione lyase
MGERTSYAPGTFCWVDLATSEQGAAKDFYGALLGWDYDDVPIGDGAVYSLAKLGEHVVCGLATRPDASVPPHWNCYVAVESADASLARAVELGATAVLEAADVGPPGRLAVFQDPQGAILSLWQPGERIGADLVNEVGALTWNDLLSPDVEGSAAFYRELFGWEIAEVPGSGGQYYGIANQGNRNAGLMPSPPGAHPVWNLYFAVEDCDAAVAKAGELGGALVMGPMDVPAGRFAIVRDPQGAVFSVGSGQRDP